MKDMYADLPNKGTVATDCQDPHAFAVVLEGDSMVPAFKEGDRVVFAPNAEVKDGDAVMVRLKDGRIFFKYYYSAGRKGSRVRLVSENPAYAPMEFKRSELHFIYKAFEVKRLL